MIRARNRFRYFPIVALATLLGLGPVWYASGDERAKAAVAGDAAQPFATFLSTHCFACHSNEKQKADLNLEHLFATATPQVEDRRRWDAVLHMLKNREMPPDPKPQPSVEERDMALAFLRETLRRFNTAGPADPGRVTIRRLNRAEYENTIRDLMGVSFAASEHFPRDEVGYGFDNIGDVLSLSPLLMEKYLDAAGEIVDRGILSQLPLWPPVRRFEETEMKRTGGDDAVRIADGGFLGLYREGAGVVKVPVSIAGNYELHIRAYQDQAGPEPAVMAVRLGKETLREIDVAAEGKSPETYAIPVALKEGEVEVSVAYTNNYNNQDSRDRRLRGDRNLFVDYVELSGPLGVEPPPLPETHRRIIPRNPEPGEEETVAREVFERFATRAYRRPATPAEVERLWGLTEMVMDDGGTFEEGIQVAVQAVLTSPHFLFRWELDQGETDREIRSLNGYELASRLSYFLWSSMPDEALFAKAADGSLADAAVLVSEAMRMLKDPKASALVEDFAGQWLQTRNLAGVEPDPETFPEFDEALRAAMQRETELFVADIVQNDRSVLEFLDADFTYMNERLARHYGIEGVEGDDFRKVVLASNSRRGGVLTHASVLTITSNPTRTSPVIRGKWVLEQILGTPPPPPPPDVEPLAESREASEAASLRERLELHRSKPDCAGCHSKMDPIGFALENYDAIGRWRDLDGNFVIDASAEMTGGIPIDGPEDLKRVLREKEDFVNALADKLLTYALGRGTEYYDDRAIHHIIEGLKKEDHRFSALVRGIVTSDPFRRRKLEPSSS